MNAEYKLLYIKRYLEETIKQLEEEQKELKDHYSSGKLRAYKNILSYLED